MQSQYDNDLKSIESFKDFLIYLIDEIETHRAQYESHMEQIWRFNPSVIDKNNEIIKKVNKLLEDNQELLSDIYTKKYPLKEYVSLEDFYSLLIGVEEVED